MSVGSSAKVEGRGGSVVCSSCPRSSIMSVGSSAKVEGRGGSVQLTTIDYSQHNGGKSPRKKVINVG